MVFAGVTRQPLAANPNKPEAASADSPSAAAAVFFWATSSSLLMARSTVNTPAAALAAAAIIPAMPPPGSTALASRIGADANAASLLLAASMPRVSMLSLTHSST